MSSIHEKFYEAFSQKAAGYRVNSLTTGLKYTAVTIRKSGVPEDPAALQCGVAYTWHEGRCCSREGNCTDYEGALASDLLPLLCSGNSPEVFSDYGVDLLAGTVPLDIEKTISIIRQGGGTRDFQKYGKKVVYAVQ